ncbi:hypothetical protein [Priestia megaterium]|uniref:hypothetical protein n=1 Tax=Priestia megaterium TaxID=1404 RepID=UPI00064C81E8|nr:hypothetical protein [Priestia megaterium]KLV28662.1 hypothetical protein ABW04_28550 [Priestia megaterium]
MKMPSIVRKPRLSHNTKTVIQRTMDEYPILIDNWVFAPADEGLKGIIIQNDLDGLTSGMEYSELTGLPIVGIFDYQRLWFDPKYTDIDPKECVWIDCDVSQSDYYSIGNHVTMASNRDYSAINNFNLSNEFGIHGKRSDIFSYHYTGSTLVMIYAINKKLSALSDSGKRLVAFADGFYNNKVTFPETKMDVWLKKLNLYDDLSPVVPQGAHDTAKIAEYGRLIGEINWRKAGQWDKPFFVQYDGVVHCEFDVDRIMKLLNLTEKPAILNATLETAMKFDTGIKNIDEMPSFQDKNGLQSVLNLPNKIFALSFIGSNKILFNYEVPM